MEDNFVKCRDGKEYEIFPALIKDKNKVRHYSAKFNATCTVLNILAPDLEKIKRAEANGEELSIDDSFTDEPYNAMMEILYLAFGEKVPKEKIEEIVDYRTVPKILEIFYCVSGYDKKKVMPILV
jgi:hypothetical protein